MKKFFFVIWFIGLQVCFQDIAHAQTSFENRGITLTNLVTNEIETLEPFNGKVIVKKRLAEPTLFRLYQDQFENHWWKEIFLDSQATEIIFGDLKIKGGKTQKEYEEFELLVKIVDERSEVISLSNRASRESMSEENKQALRNLEKERNKIVEKFIADNPSSYATAKIAFEYWRSSTDKQKISKIYNDLDENIQKSFFGKLLKKLNEDNSKIEIGNLAPYFEIKESRGQTISNYAIYANYTLIQFWASWCASCQKENIYWSKINNQNMAKGLAILGVSLDKNKKDWLEAIKKDKLNWLHGSQLQGWDSKVVDLYNIQSIPYNVLIDRFGKIVAKDLRGRALNDELNKILK